MSDYSFPYKDAAFLINDECLEIIIFAYNKRDECNNDEECLLLSEKRAESIKQFIVKKGADEKRVHRMGIGEIPKYKHYLS